MARIRYIKPDFFTDEKIIELGFSSRLLFIGLWTLVDREGRMEYSAKQIKIRLFPTDDLNISDAMQELSDAGLLVGYEVEGKTFFQITNFERHQRPHPKEAASQCPAVKLHGKQFNFTASKSSIPSSPVIKEQNIKEQKGDSETDPEPESGIEGVSNDLVIQQTETAFNIRLDLKTKQLLTRGIPKKLAHLWPQFVNGRAIGFAKKSDAEKLVKIGYCITDFQKDNKYEQPKPEQRLRTPAEVEAERERHRKENPVQPPPADFVQRLSVTGQTDKAIG
jgi:hypothetical protein